MSEREALLVVYGSTNPLLNYDGHWSCRMYNMIQSNIKINWERYLICWYYYLLHIYQLKGIFEQWKCMHHIDTYTRWLWKYTERKKKRNTTFDIEFQNNDWIYFYNIFNARKSNESLFMIWLIVSLSSKRHQKAGNNSVPHTKSKVCRFWRYWVGTFPLCN